MAKIRKFALGGVAGVDTPMAGGPGSTTVNNNLQPGNISDLAPFANVMSGVPQTTQMTPGTSTVSNSIQPGNPADLAPFANVMNSMPKPQSGGALFRPGMGGPMGRFGNRFGGMGRPSMGNQFPPSGADIGMRGGINPNAQTLQALPQANTLPVQNLAEFASQMQKGTANTLMPQYKKGGAVKKMEAKPSKNYTGKDGKINLGHGRVSTAQKNKKSSNW